MDASAENMTNPQGSTIFGSLNFGYSVFLVADEELRVDDKVSLIFLLFEDSVEALNKATLVIEASNTCSYRDILVLWAKSCGLLWRQTFLEALMIIKNFNIIDHILDVDWQTIDRYYPLNSFQTAFVHPVKKIMYIISEALVREETNKIITEIRNIFSFAETMTIEEIDVNFFEIFLLKLINGGFMELGTWRCQPIIIPASLNKANLEGFKFILFHLNFNELCDLLSAIERKFNELISDSLQPSRGFEFEEDQEIIAARLKFNSWVESGLNKLSASPSKDESEPTPSSSHTQNVSLVEEQINKESQNNGDGVDALMLSLRGIDLSETTGVSCAERADDLQQSMDIVEELENMNLGENLDHLTQGPSTYLLARGETYSIDTQLPKIYVFNNCFDYENEDKPSIAEYFKKRPNAVIEEEFVTNAFQSLCVDKYKYVLEQANYIAIDGTFEYTIDFKENPSMLVFFMVCYGLNGYIIFPDGEPFKRENLERRIVNIPELVGKPKILIIQTYMLDDVRLPKESSECRHDLMDLFSLWVAIPYQMHEGRSPFESELPGVSVFLKTFCAHLEVMDSNKDFVSFCHDVCSNVKEKTNGALMPKYDSYLSKLLYLK